MQATFLYSRATVLPTTKLPLTAPTNRYRCLSITAQSQATMRTYSSSTLKLKKCSSRISERKSRGQGASQATSHGFGLSDDDLSKPQVGIHEGSTCNTHLLKLKLCEEVKRGVEESGMAGFRLSMVGVSDEISMGMGGKGKGLQSGDLTTDTIVKTMSAQWYHGFISISGCDKNMPGTIMAMGRLNRPSIMVYGGTIKPDYFQGNSYDIVSAFQCISGKIRDWWGNNFILNSCPGAGACGGMYTANTMASAIEAMGMCLPYSSSIPAEDPLKLDECHLAGKYLLELLKMDIKPRDIITHRSLRNAMVVAIALGGSTNDVLHLSAIARSVGLELTFDDFQKVSDEVWFLAGVMEDVHKVGGTPAVIHCLLDLRYLDGDCMTVTGKTVAENAESYTRLPDRQEIIKPVSSPIKKTGNIQILRGNLAPEGSVAKLPGKEGTYFSGPALVFEGEEAMIAAISENPLSFKGKAVVIRGEGPKGRPGMPEMLTPTSAIMGAGLGRDVALLSDGRFSGGSHGFVVGHICPEAQEGGPIGLIRNGDLISIDARRRAINVELTDAELNERRKMWNPLPYKANRGVSHKPSHFHGNAYHIVSAFPVNIRRACQGVGAFVSNVLLFQPDWNLYAIDVPATVMGVLAATLMAKVMAEQPLVLRLFFVELARRWTVDFVKYISTRREQGKA